ncbi:MAG: acyl-CoA dehydrogenase family protein, partial [Caulobacteraceae bacterium]
ILGVALPLIMSVYAGVAEAAAEGGRRQAAGRAGDPSTAYLLGELAVRLATAQLAVDDMVRLADDLRFEASLEVSDAMLVRKAIAADAVLATAEKAVEAAGGAGFYRDAGLERLLRDAHAAQFHPLTAKRQQRFTGRLALGLDPIADAA